MSLEVQYNLYLLIVLIVLATAGFYFANKERKEVKRKRERPDDE